MNDQQSGSAPSHDKPVTIIINGTAHTVTQHRVSYEQVVRLAFPEGPFDITYTVDYANDHGPDGTLTQGQDTKVRASMSFNVIKSNRS
jgi:Multiubiquitin